MGSTTHIQVFSQGSVSSGPWDISKSTLQKQKDVSAHLPVGINIAGIFINKPGTKLFVLEKVNAIVYQFSFGTANDLDSLTYEKQSASLFTTSNAVGVHFSDDGLKCFVGETSVSGNAGDLKVYQISLQNAFDVGNLASGTPVTLSLPKEDTSGNTDQGLNMSFNPDGTFVYYLYKGTYLGTPNTLQLKVKKLSTAFDLSSVTTIGGGAAQKVLAKGTATDATSIYLITKNNQLYGWPSPDDFSKTYFLISTTAKVEHRDLFFNQTKSEQVALLKSVFQDKHNFFTIDSNKIIKHFKTNYYE